jgi:HTH-type transcriptional regulator / antitoxin HigA
MDIRPIRTEEDYKAALIRIEKIWDSESGTPEDDELEILVSQVERYERRKYSSTLPDPIEAIKIRMEDLGLTRKDLEPLIGTRARVSEILNRRRQLSVSMIRKLSHRLGLPAEVLLQPYPLAKELKSKGEDFHTNQESCAVCG